VTINQTLQGESVGVLASILAHEALHAVTAHNTDLVACFAEETAAFVTEAATWAAVPPNVRSSSVQAQMLDALVAAFRQQGAAGILKTVTNDPAYQQECASNAGMHGQAHPLRVN